MQCCGIHGVCRSIIASERFLHKSNMRFLVFFLLVVLAVSLASPVPPKRSSELHRLRRAPQNVKGQKGSRVPNPLNLRKGEYICGNKVCSLKPGQIPPNCGGVCQYKV